MWNKIVEFVKQWDKQMHFLVGMLTGSGAYAASYDGNKLIASLITIIFCFLLGAAKEIYDKNTTGLFDWKDILATTLGSVPVIIGAIIIL